MNKNIIDLTHTINEKMTVFPGEQKAEVNRIKVFEKDGYAVTELKLTTHTGTHIDAPGHLIGGGKTLDQLQMGVFTGKAVCVNCEGVQEISLNLLKTYSELISNADFVLFNSGWYKKWNSEDYFDQYPVLTIESAKLLSSFDLKAVGFDYISVDPVSSTDLPLHKTFLSRDILIIENLTSLDLLPAGLFDFFCIPLKIELSDGSPVRAFAYV